MSQTFPLLVLTWTQFYLSTVSVLSIQLIIIGKNIDSTYSDLWQYFRKQNIALESDGAWEIIWDSWNRQLFLRHCVKEQKIKMEEEKKTREDQQQIIFYYSLAPNNLSNKITCFYHLKRQQPLVHKSMQIDQRQKHIYLMLYQKKRALYCRLMQLKGLNRNIFSHDIQLREHQNYHKQVPNKILLQLRQPVIEGVNLAECIRQKNTEMVPVTNYFISLLIDLLSIFIHADQETLLVPSFRNIIVEPKNNSVSLNVFSFTGWEILYGEESIDSSIVMEIVAFFPSDYGQSKAKGVSMQRALVIILLGILIGKQINLHPRATFIDKKITRAKFMSLVAGNRQKFTKIIKSQQAGHLFETIKNNHKVRLKQIMSTLLVEEREVSWSQFKQIIFEETPVQYAFSVGAEQNSHKLSINSFIHEFGQRKWRNLDANEQQQIISNKLLSIKRVEEELNEIDAQMLLIYTMNIDLSVLMPATTLVGFINYCQGKDSFKFDSQTMQLRDKFMKELVDYMDDPARKVTMKKTQLKEDNTTIETTCPRKLFTTYGSSQNNLTEEQNSQAFIELWTEPQISKFDYGPKRQRGELLSSRLQTLREYSKCILFDDDQQ